MKLVKIKVGACPAKCKSCGKDTTTRIQGGHYGGRRICAECYKPLKVEYDKQQERERNYPGGEIANEHVDYYTR